MTIYYPDTDFDFSKLHLSQPIVTANGSFFSKINITCTDDPLFIYTPKGTTRQGIVTTNNKTYTDLLFTSTNTNIIQWVSLLEERLQQLIYEKKDIWFATENIEFDDIQNAFIPMIKVYKNSNYLLRSYIQQSKHQLKGEPLLIYNESEQPCTITDITDKSNLITILEIQGVKFSQKCFHVPIVIKQIMMFQKTSFNHVLIKSEPEDSKETPNVKSIVESNVQVEKDSKPIKEPQKDKVEQIKPSDKEKRKNNTTVPVKKQEQPKMEISEIDIKLNSLDEIILKNPLEEYNALITQIKESSLQAKKAYSIAKDLKEQFNIEDELPLL